MKKQELNAIVRELNNAQARLAMARELVPKQTDAFALGKAIRNAHFFAKEAIELAEEYLPGDETIQELQG